jgi:hypothetical protein
VSPIGKRGPLPKQGLQRRKDRREALEAATTTVETTGGAQAPFEPDDDWHPLARSFYESLEDSDVSELYQDADWAKAYLLAEQLSRELKPQFLGLRTAVEVVEVNGEQESHLVQKPVAGVVPMKGSSISAIQAMMASLGVSIGDRQRMGLELKRVSSGPEPVSAAQAAVQAMKDELTAKREEKKKAAGQ